MPPRSRSAVNIALATSSTCATSARISRLYASGLSGWTETLRARFRGIKWVRLLTTIGGIGETTAAMLIAELGDPVCFASAAALTAYVGLFAGHKHSGKSQPKNSSLSPLGSRRVRRALWMPTSSAATQSNPWLMVFYRRLQLHAFLDDMDHLVFLSKHCAGLTRGCVCAMDIEWPV